VPFPASLLPAKLAGSLLVDAGDARSLLGWQPPFGVDEGLARTVAGYRA
jgi:nucleoside-diphosphate-sugar epimerase